MVTEALSTALRGARAAAEQPTHSGASPRASTSGRPKPRKRPTTALPRVACVHLPHVSVAVEERDQPALKGRPLAIAAPEPGRRTVMDASAAALKAGVFGGMGLEQARQVCPDLTVLPARTAAYAEALTQLMATLGEFGDQIEPADPEHSWLATGELSALGEGEHSLAEELVHRVRHDVGIVARLGMAGGKHTSRIVSDYVAAQAFMVLPAGHEVSFLGGLVTRYLPLAQANHERLWALGISKIHQYAALPGAGILPRFGFDGLRAYRLAHGEDEAQLRPYSREPLVTAEQVYLDPISDHRQLDAGLAQLADEVMGLLAAEFQMAGRLVLGLGFEGGAVQERERRLAAPSPSARLLVTHAQALLGMMRLEAPVERVTLAVQGMAPTPGRQLALFQAESEAEDELAVLLTRLDEKYGPEVVLRGHSLLLGAPLHERRAYLAPWEAEGDRSARSGMGETMI